MSSDASDERHPSIPPADRQVVAVVDRDAVAALVGFQAVRATWAPASAGLTIVGAGPRPDVRRRVKALLERRKVDTCLHELRAPDDDRFTLALAEACTRALEADRERWPVLDISGASPGRAVQAVRVARRCWEGRGSVTAYDAVRDAVRVLDPRAPGQDPEELRVDLGAPEGGSVAPDEFFGLFGLRTEEKDPYGPAVGHDVDRDLLLKVSLGVLRVFRDDQAAYDQFRNVLFDAREQSDEDAPVLLPVSAIPARMLDGLQALDRAALLKVVGPRGNLLELAGDSGNGASFLLSGGWLEVAATEALQRALPDRPVSTNVETAWGAGNPWRLPCTEVDVAFLHHNRLHVVSCKNDRNARHLKAEVDTFRGRVAEFGEHWVRPTLLSTLPLPEPVLDRCRAYEIGVLYARPLLDLLHDDLVRGEAGLLLAALGRADRGTPEPGVAGGQRLDGRGA